MIRKSIAIPVFIVFTLISSVFAFVGLIEKNIGSYQYQEVSLPPGVAYQELTYAIYRLEGTNKDFQVRISSYEDGSSLNDYLYKHYYESTIKPKKYEKEIIYSERNGENLFWINGNNILFIGSERNNPYNFPEEIVKAYIDTYPKKCSIDWCKNELCDKILWSKAPYSGGVYQKHNGFTIWCKGRVMYGKEGKITKPDLTLEQFKEELNRKLFTEINFTNEEIERNYLSCAETGSYEFKGLPMEGFLKGCYDRVYPLVGKNIVEKDEETCEKWRNVGEDHESCYGSKEVDSASIDVCESVRFTIKENDYDDNLMNDIIDCNIERELESREKQINSCKNWEEGDEPIAGCNELKNKEEAGVKEVAKTEDYDKNQEQSIIMTIISFFKNLFS